MRSVIEQSTSRRPSKSSESKLLTIDMHSHILPSLDDGSENMEVALSLAKGMYKRGYKKIIVSPHIMKGYYNNDEEKIRLKVKMLAGNLENEGVDLKVDYAAEYYLDQHFMAFLHSNQKPITIGRNTNFVLIETSFVEQFQTLLSCIDALLNIGYRPVLAHPERYIYLEESNNRFEKLQNLGVLFQVNINSLAGYYSKQAKLKAEHLIQRDMVSFLGTNCHNEIQLQTLDYAIINPFYQLALSSSRLLNNALV